MNYREKLNHIRSLVHEAQTLSLRYGFFYITCAMITFYPQLPIKLSIWVHPNLN